jgi:hypothetical protein
LSNPNQQPTDTEPTEPANAKPDARPKPVLYTFTCGGARVPCKLTYTYDSDLHKQRKLPAPPKPK